MLPAIPFVRVAGGGSGGGVTGPGSSTDNAVPRFDGTGGSTLQDSGLTISDSGNVTFPARMLGKQGADVASSSDLSLGSGNYFIITGTTTIEGIIASGWTAGSIVVLQFTASLTVAHAASPGTADPFLLAGAVNFSATASDTLTLVRDEANGVWRELARTVI